MRWLKKNKNEGNVFCKKCFFRFYLCCPVEKKQIRILEVATVLFKKYGLKSITMDDVAREAGISKKTLYSFFENKNHLIGSIISDFLNRHATQAREINNRAATAIEEYYLISKMVLSSFSDLPPALVYDLRKYHSDVWVQVERFQNGVVTEIMKENLRRGIAEGIYRGCMNVEIIAAIYSHSVNNLLQQGVIPDKEYTFEQIFREFFIYHASGICNDRGKELLTELFQTDKKTK